MNLRLPLTSVLRALLLTMACSSASMAHAKEALPPPQKLPTTSLRAGMHLIKAEVAQHPREHMVGLMSRTSMGLNEGMLFIFPQATKQCFWMKNTLIPLQIAFIADDGSVVNLDEMLPQTEHSHCATQPVRYVLEMNKGWFSKRGIRAGTRLTGGPFGTP